MDKLIDKQLNKIVEAIDNFRKTTSQLEGRKEIITELEKIREDFGLAKSVFARKLGLERQEYDAITKSKYTKEYILKLLTKAKKFK